MAGVLIELIAYVQVKRNICITKASHMKKLILSIAFILFAATVSAQFVPSFQFGIKGGMNLSRFSKYNTLSSDNQAGYLGGIWARIGVLGFNVQPEVYYAHKTATVTDGLYTVTTNFNSIDVPLLVGYKLGALGFGARLNTGPVASFIINQNQSTTTALGNIGTLNFKNQAYAWQFGAGVDAYKLSLDLRFEKGLTNINDNGYDQKLNLFNLTLAYKIY